MEEATVQFRVADVENWTFGRAFRQTIRTGLLHANGRFLAIFHRRQIGLRCEACRVSTGFNALVRLPRTLSFLHVSPISRLLLPGRVDAVSNNGA